MCFEGQKGINENSHQKRLQLNILYAKGQRGCLNSGGVRRTAFSCNMQKFYFKALVMMDTISADGGKLLNEPSSNRFHL